MRIPNTTTYSGTFGTAELLRLDESTLHAVLATVSEGSPYTSLVSYAFDAEDRGVVFLTPRATRKYANIMKNPAVSLLIDTASNSGEDYMEASAYTITGRAIRVRKGRRSDRLIEVFLRKHPALGSFARAEGTAVVYVEIIKCTRASRFQSISTWDPDSEIDSDVRHVAGKRPQVVRKQYHAEGYQD